VRADEERVTLSWAGPIQGSGWDVGSFAYAVSRSFRLSGYNTPTQYMEPIETPAGSGDFVWTLRTFADADYAYPAGNLLALDARYEGIVAGSRILVSRPGAPGSHTVVTVKAVSQGQVSFKPSGAATTPFQDTVTLVTVEPALPALDDRRTTTLHEIKSPRVQFWGYRYPDAVTGGVVYVAARRIDPETAEVGRAIQGNAYTAGVPLPLRAVDVGRKVVLVGPAPPATAAIVTAASVVGLDVGVGTTPDDFTTAVELRLVPEAAQRLIGLRSASLPSSLPIGSAGPFEVSVTIGSLPARVISLGGPPATPSAAAALLEAGLTASLPAVPEFAQSRVLVWDGALLVLPGVAGAMVTFTATPDDPTTATALGLLAPQAFAVDGLLSGDLSGFTGLSNPRRELSVTLGPLGPRTVALGAPVTGPSSARAALQAAIRSADPAPAFATARVRLLDGTRLLVLPGTAGVPIQEYLALTLQPESPFQLSASSAVLLGNVAQASHGETVDDEVLGDGDASLAFQRFELQKKPLTYVPSAGPDGVDSSLRVQVNDVLWTETATLFGRGPAEQVYTTRLADDGTVSVFFGDGRTGARLPSGRGNVVADYRHGSGLQGRVPAGSLRSPLDLPVGLKSVGNPAAATGGADPESIEQARENAPTTVRTFGRAVSLADFEDLVRSSGEVAKALATWVWNGEARAVHLTVAAQGGQRFTEGDLARIHASLDARRDPNHALFLANYTPVPIVVKALLRVHADRVAAKVAAAARDALLGALSFETLRFGQPVALSQIYAVLQQVAGVDSVDIDLFSFKDQTPAFLTSRGATADPLQRSLRIFAARPNPDPPPPSVLPAEIAEVEEPATDVQLSTSGGLPE
jgi:predicted phage baseplate assembly protein